MVYVDWCVGCFDVYVVVIVVGECVDDFVCVVVFWVDCYVGVILLCEFELFVD